MPHFLKLFTIIFFVGSALIGCGESGQATKNDDSTIQEPAPTNNTTTQE